MPAKQPLPAGGGQGFSVTDAGPCAGDVLASKDGSIPDLVLVTPDESARSAWTLMRDLGVSQVVVSVSKEPPLAAKEVSGTLDELSPVQAAFNEHYAAQCGYCTPGFVLATTALLERNAAPSRDEVLEVLGGNVCRCTGYETIVDAVVAVVAKREEATA